MSPGDLFNEAIYAITRIVRSDASPLQRIEHLVLLRREINLQLGELVDHKSNEGLKPREAP